MKRSARPNGNGGAVRLMPLGDCLDEVTRGIGAEWKKFPLLGATRAGLAPAKEAIGKTPERYKPLEPGTVFYNPMRILLGSIALVDDADPPGITSPDYVVLRARPGVLHHRVFYYWLRSTAGEQLIRSLARGAVRERILFKRLAVGEMPVPPWSVQQRVAESLALIPKLRRAAQDRLAAAEALPAAYLREVFEGPEASRWEPRQLHDVAEIVSGITLGRRLGRDDTRRVPYLRVANVKDGCLDLRDVYEIEATEREIEELALRRGDLLLTEGGDRDKLGRGTFWEEQLPLCLHQNHIFRVRLSADYCPRFVSWQVGSSYGKSYFLRHAKQTTGIATINRGVLGSFPLLSPPLATQQSHADRLAKRLNNAEGLIARCREELNAIEALPAALLREAFNGVHGDDGQS
ncbi:MAG: restriction endonuclease subunit S [Planctomycetes bacterium]|nr:restriction endonuclease subunit S [Planctomycetota bacterium]